MAITTHSTTLRPSLAAWLRKFVFGKPLASSAALAHRLPIGLALPVFASDNISSSAYCNQEILIVLASVSLAGGGSALGLQIWITLAIALIMLIVVTSYRRAVLLYPTSGGSYTVAKSNLGPFIGLIAAAALFIDYIMTVAVSISAGVDALVSAYPVLLPEKILIAVLLVGVLTLANLRGAQESGWIFALPMYVFVLVMGTMIVTALAHFIAGGGHVAAMGADPGLPAHLRLPDDIILPKAGAALGLFILLRAFANGSSAMTGTEAVSNGVSAFKPPEAKNAANTLVIMAGILLFLMLGIGFLAHIYRVVPSETETVVSMVARATFGYHLPYYITQFATLAILMVAANTSFAGFPRLMAHVARDGFAPKAFTSLGDRLVFHRGILALALISVVVIVALKANVTALIGLYSIGVFICFTLSQLGMSRKLRELRERGWHGGVILNLVGAAVTGLVAVVVAVSKFTEGAWMVLVLIPLVILICYLIQRHYEWFERTMTVRPEDSNPLAESPEPVTVLVLVSSDIHRGILEGLECGRALTAGRQEAVLRAVHIEMDPEKTERLKTKWAQYVEPHLGQQIKLDIVPSPYRWLVEPILDYLDWVDLERSGDRIIVVLPEFETGNPLTHFLHNFTARRLRAVLLNRPHITVVSSRFFMKPMAWRLGRGGLVY
ncbi:MAG: APC family permease [Armatimonadota bacterium]